MFMITDILLNQWQKVTPLGEINKRNSSELRLNGTLPDNHFIPINGKIPIERDWLNNTHPFNHCLDLVKRGKGNGIGYVLRNQGVLCIDCDGQDAIDLANQLLPSSLGISYFANKSNTPKKDNSCCYWLLISPENLEKLNEIAPSGKIVIKLGKNGHNKEIQLEIRFNNCYQVFNSIHPDTNKPYEVITEGVTYLREITTREIDKIITNYQDYIVSNKKHSLVLDNKKQGRKVSKIIEKCNISNNSLKEIKEFLDSLPSNYCNDYDKWIKVIAACKNASYGKDDSFVNWVIDLLDNWSSLSESYKNKEEIIKKFNSFDPLRDGAKATISSIYSELGIKIKKDYSQEFLNQKSLNSDYQFNSEGYLSENNYDKWLNEGKKFTFIKSGLGTGKTFNLAKYTGIYREQIKSEGKELYLFLITHRQSLEHQLASVFSVTPRSKLQGFSSYENKGIVTCIDSINFIFNGAIYKEALEKKLDNKAEIFIICDELSQLLDHTLMSKTDIRKNRFDKINNFCEMVYDANKFIAMDGHLCDSDITKISDILGINVRENSYIVDNIYQNLNYNFSLLTAQECLNKVVNDLRAKKEGKDIKTIAITTSGQKSKTLYGTKNIEKYISKKVSDIRILICDSETLHNIDSEYFRLINTHGDNWKNYLNDYDLVIFSPVIETGFSIDNDIKFEYLVGINLGNQKPENFLQHINRIRDNCTRYIAISERTLNKHKYTDCDKQTLKDNYFKLSKKANKEYTKLIKEIELLDGDPLQDTKEKINNYESCLLKDSAEIDSYKEKQTNIYSAVIETIYVDNLGFNNLGTNIINLLLNSGCKLVDSNNLCLSNEENFNIHNEVKEIREESIKEQCSNEFNSELITESKYESLTSDKKFSLSTKEQNEVKKYKKFSLYGSSNTGNINNVTGGLYLTSYKDNYLYPRLKELHNMKLYKENNKLFKETLLKAYSKNTTCFDVLENNTKQSYDKTELLFTLLYSFIKSSSAKIYQNNDKQIENLNNLILKNKEEIKEHLGITITNPSSVIKNINKVLSVIGYKLKQVSRSKSNRKYQLCFMYSDIVSQKQLNKIFLWWEYKAENNIGYKLISDNEFRLITKEITLSEYIKITFKDIVLSLRKELTKCIFIKELTNNIYDKINGIFYNLRQLWENTNISLPESLKGLENIPKPLLDSELQSLIDRFHSISISAGFEIPF